VWWLGEILVLVKNWWVLMSVLFSGLFMCMICGCLFGFVLVLLVLVVIVCFFCRDWLCVDNY